MSVSLFAEGGWHDQTGTESRPGRPEGEIVRYIYICVYVYVGLNKYIGTIIFTHIIHHVYTERVMSKFVK